MKNKLNKSTLNQLVNHVINKRYIYGAVFYVSSDDNSIDVISACGNLQEESQYYIASINKLIISSIILKLYTINRLDLHDKISKYLTDDFVRQLHLYKGKDYSGEITVAHLLSQTSGLPCYLIDKQLNGRKAMSELEAGMDQSWPIDKVITEIKKMKTHFPPGANGKAKYIDTVGRQNLSERF
jgi:CubicO group peptidase (beta-lactamase class C family)